MAASLISAVLFGGCKKDDFEEMPGLCPVVSSTDPANLAVSVPLNKVITVTFNEPMNPLTINANSFTIDGLSPVAGNVTLNGSVATFTPTANLASNTTFTGRIRTTAKDLMGNALQTDYVWTFSTGITLSPVVLYTSPINNATGVVLNKVITANFSVPMDPLTITDSTFTIRKGATLISGTISYNDSTASFDPLVDLTPNTVYVATIKVGAKNLAGTPLVSNYVWTFTTGALVAPKVILTNPLNNALNVPITQVITAQFDVAMNPLTISTTSFTVKNGLIAVPGSVSYLGTTATFNPTANLLPGVIYTATITTGAQNVAGTGLANNHIWKFTTVAGIPPTVTVTDPLDNATDVVLNKTITADFSVPMDPLTISTTTFTVKLGAVNVPGTVSYVGSTASFNPTANLQSGETYTATITTGAENLTGTPLAANYVWTFDTKAPLGPLAPVLASVARFGIISGVGVSNNAGPSQINNLDVGIYPGARSSITGFMDVDGGPGLISGGAFYASDDIAPPGVAAMLLQAKNDLVIAYNQAAGATIPAPAVAPADLGGQTLAPGIWTSATTMLLQNGNLTLDAQGDINAVWIFQVGTAFTSVGSGPYPSAAGGNVILAGGAKAENVYWVVGSSATIGDYTSFYGTILAFSSITMNTGSTATGRMLARNASVILTSTNIINKP